MALNSFLGEGINGHYYDESIDYNEGRGCSESYIKKLGRERDSLVYAKCQYCSSDHEYVVVKTRNGMRLQYGADIRTLHKCQPEDVKELIDTLHRQIDPSWEPQRLRMTFPDGCLHNTYRAKR